MRIFVWMGVPAILTAVLLVALAVYRNSRIQSDRESRRIHVVLVGASIGQSWRLNEWPSRTRSPGFTAESIAVWQFDKTQGIDEILLRPAVRFRLSRSYLKELLRPPRPPGIVILKECSSYFPGDLATYQDNVRKWVGRLRDHHVKVALATVVPVTRARATQDRGKQEMLLEYNRWIREYASTQSLLLIDLEAALRSQADGSFLREELAAPDGSHLNPNAYAVLDQTLSAGLCAVTPPPVCRTTPVGTITP
jgi:hypothetical protein